MRFPRTEGLRPAPAPPRPAGSELISPATCPVCRGGNRGSETGGPRPRAGGPAGPGLSGAFPVSAQIPRHPTVLTAEIQRSRGGGGGAGYSSLGETPPSSSPACVLPRLRGLGKPGSCALGRCSACSGPGAWLWVTRRAGDPQQLGGRGESQVEHGAPAASPLAGHRTEGPRDRGLPRPAGLG